MSQEKNALEISITNTRAVCPKGQAVGKMNHEQGKVPVLSCEGACIRGEIARVAANMLAKEEPFSRACHGEFITAPHSEIAVWVEKAGKVVLIDGCFMKCHGRIIENLIGEDKLLRFDALSIYKKYTDLFDADSIPEQELKAVARQVADAVLEQLAKEVPQGEVQNCATACN